MHALRRQECLHHDETTRHRAQRPLKKVHQAGTALSGSWQSLQCHCSIKEHGTRDWQENQKSAFAAAAALAHENDPNDGWSMELTPGSTVDVVQAVCACAAERFIVHAGAARDKELVRFIIVKKADVLSWCGTTLSGELKKKKLLRKVDCQADSKTFHQVEQGACGQVCGRQCTVVCASSAVTARRTAAPARRPVRIRPAAPTRWPPKRNLPNARGHQPRNANPRQEKAGEDAGHRAGGGPTTLST